MKLIKIWPKGYARFSSRWQRLIIDDHIDPHKAAIAAFGKRARVFKILDFAPSPIETFMGNVADLNVLLADIKVRLAYWDEARMCDLPDNRGFPEVPTDQVAFNGDGT